MRYVELTKDAGVATITFSNPPVNALGLDARTALYDSLLAVRDDPDVSAAVIACGGRTFFAGADIAEFGTPKSLQSPNIVELCRLLGGFPKPVIAAIHGSALGGGLELALACHHRVATTDAKLGLPEVKLGLIPGAGGTVRLPRLVGAEKALSMIVSGASIDAPEAKEFGLVDKITAGDLVADAVAFAKQRAGVPPIPVSSLQVALPAGGLAALDDLIAKATNKLRGLDAPRLAAQAVRNAATMPFDDAIAAERQTFLPLPTSEQSRALRHLFFAEREATKISEAGPGVAPRDIRRVGMIGAGTMGGGIAMSFVDAAIPVTILEMSEAALHKGIETIAKNYQVSVSRGSISEAAKIDRIGRIRGTTSYADLADCDLIIEAVFEDMAVKKSVFAELDRVAKPGAILATNTSYLDVDEIARSTKRPADIVGTHYFSPANVMKLLEVVRGGLTSPDVIATILSVARRTAKTPVVVGNRHGFVGNRMLVARNEQNEALLLDGATPEEVDRAFAEFGWPMGPFQMADMAGLDIGWRNRRALGKTSPIADALCELGWFGQKTGRGFYIYENGSRVPAKNPPVETLVADLMRTQGRQRRHVTADEIIERTLYPMVNEGTRILEEGIARRASDIDVIWVRGYGFPAHKGGPMFWADLVGLPKIVDRLEYWHGATGNPALKPTDLLKSLAAAGGALSPSAQSKGWRA